MKQFRPFLTAVVIVGIVFAPVFHVCGECLAGPESNGASRGEMRETTDLVDLMERDPDVRTLITVRDEITMRVLGLGVRPDELISAYQAGDEERIIDLLGYSHREISDFRDRLNSARNAVMDRYPQIERMIQESPPPTYGAYDFSFIENLMETGPNVMDHPNCRVVPYVAALAVCSLAGPVLYWACAFVALCSFCSGGWVSAVCG